MTIVSSGTISINSLVGEYGGSSPHAMNEYYRGGSLVSDHSNNANVPTSGTIDLQDFYGANNTSPSDLVFVITPGQASGKFPLYGYLSGSYGSASDTSILVGGTTYTIQQFTSGELAASNLIFYTGGSAAAVPGLDGGDISCVSSYGTTTNSTALSLSGTTYLNAPGFYSVGANPHAGVSTTCTLTLA